jgi:hypothetical protein
MDSSSERRLELLRQQRFNEARTILTAAFATWMLPEIGNHLPSLVGLVLAMSSILVAMSWLVIIMMFAPIKREINHHTEFGDSRDELRAAEFLMMARWRYQRIALTASCMSVAITTMTIGLSQVYWF